jgi:hypothetical protein
MDGGVALRMLAVPLTPRRVRKLLELIPAIAGAADAGQGAQSSSGSGEVKLIPAIEGAVDSGQAMAEVIAIGSVDNRRPRNNRKAKLAAALLLAA